MHLLDHWPDMLTAEETAKILRIDTDTLAGFLQAGEIRHMKIAEKVIIPRKFLEDFLEIKLKARYNESVGRTVSVPDSQDQHLDNCKELDCMPFQKGGTSVKDTHVLGPPQRVQKNSPAKPQVFQGTFKLWREANLP